MAEVRSKEELRGWPQGWTAPTEQTSRYAMMCREVDEARSPAALAAIRDAAEAWLRGASTANPQGAREAAAVLDRISRRNGRP